MWYQLVMYQTCLAIVVTSETIFVLHQDGDTAMSLAKSRGHIKVVELLKKGITLTYKLPMFRIQSHVMEKLLYVHNEEVLSPICVSRIMPSSPETMLMEDQSHIQ